MNNELIIPVYLNQNNVFDLIAMMQNGLATMTRLDTGNENSSLKEANANSSLGLNKAMSLLFKADISGNVNMKQNSMDKVTKSEERYHTPSSLFFTLRNKMKEEKHLIICDNQYKPKNSDIIEFSSSVNKNPLIQIMQQALAMMDMAIAFKTPNRKNNSPKDTNEILKEQIEKFLEYIDTNRTIDVVTDELIFGYRAVITLDKLFLNDIDINDLVDGNFKIVGKIIRIIEDDANSIDLQRKTSIGIMPPDMIKGHFQEFYKQIEIKGMKVPKFELEIKGPVIQILPIAMFV